MADKTVVVCVGTRPEAIKMAPVVLALRDTRGLRVRLLTTAQHRQMLDQVLEVFSLTPDFDLNLMKPNQELAETGARILTGVQAVLRDWKPDAVLVHGDTSTSLFAALAAFYEKIPVGHVEAGLRTYDFQAPWPEEMNRRLVDPICRWCFAPTERAAADLRAERIPEGCIEVTGNTVVDALLAARDRVRAQPPDLSLLAPPLDEARRLVLVTGHRRENFGEPFKQFCLALRDIVAAVPDVELVYPVHLNPNVQRPVNDILGGVERVRLIPPVSYLPFVWLMDRAYLIITDSGGVQEEAPTLRTPVLVTREVTERPEAVEAGLAKLVGARRDAIVREATTLLTDAKAHAAMRAGENPYGDGKAARRIADRLKKDL